MGKKVGCEMDAVPYAMRSRERIWESGTKASKNTLEFTSLATCSVSSLLCRRFLMFEF